MITEQAIITRCLGNRIELQLQRQSACGHCELSQGCGTGALGRLLGRRARPLVIDNEHDLKTGDSVVLGLSEQVLVRASLLIYGLPLVGMIMAGIAASLFPANREGLVIAAAIAGFFIGHRLAAHLVNFSVRTHLVPGIIKNPVNSGMHSES